MLTIIKVFIILFYSTCENLEQPDSFQSIFQISVSVYSLLGQTEGKRKAFFGECKKGDRVVRLPSRALGCHKR